MNLEQLKRECKNVGDKYPDKEQEVFDILQTAIMEIEDGESEWNECELAMESLEDMLCKMGD